VSCRLFQRASRRCRRDHGMLHCVHSIAAQGSATGVASYGTVLLWYYRKHSPQQHTQLLLYYGPKVCCDHTAMTSGRRADVQWSVQPSMQ
jgi:hypothetical protein